MGRGSSVCRLGGGKRFVWLGACLLPMSMALAQIAPAEDATQELLRQQERERALRQRQESKPDVRLERGVAAETGRLPADESPCFRIDRITLTGTPPSASSGRCLRPIRRTIRPPAGAWAPPASTW